MEQRLLADRFTKEVHQKPGISFIYTMLIEYFVYGELISGKTLMRTI